MAIGLLLLRFTIGLTLAAHGAQKLFGWFGGHGLDGTGKGLEMLGFVPGRRHALLAGVTETGGGLLLTLGLLTPLAASVVFAVMLVASLSAHANRGFFLATGGFEYTLVLGLSGLTLAFTGPGVVSLDALFGFQAGGALLGTAALLVGLAAGAMQLRGRHQAHESHAVAA